MSMSATLLIPPDEGGIRWDRIKAVGFALAAAVLVFIGTIGFITLLNTSSTLGVVNTTLKAVRHGQVLHVGTINAINANTRQTKRIADGLASGNKNVSKIFGEAYLTSQALLTAIDRVESQNSAICAAVHTSC